jgi:hypothetical protein
MRTIGIVCACVCIVLGWWTASLPNTSQRLPGVILAGYGATILILTILGKATVVKWMLLGAAILAFVAYALPMSFWRFLGLANKG